MIPVVTAAQMASADRAVLAASAGCNGADVLVRRAGAAVAHSALRMLGGGYGRRVTVIAGKGNNGADGRVAAERLAERGSVVRVVDADACEDLIVDHASCDLLIDAAYGTGFRGEWCPPGVWGVPVLAVDIPSGLEADTGAASGHVLAATRTVTFAALKRGHLFGDGPRMCGVVEVADIGVDVLEHVEDVTTFLVEPHDVVAWLPPRPRTAHKWNDAVRVVAGSSGMTGSCALVCAAAMRSGAGIVHASVRGDDPLAGATLPTEVVHRAIPVRDWSIEVLRDLDRFSSLVVGPGIGRGDELAADVRSLVARSSLPTVVDGDGLRFLVDAHGDGGWLAERTAPTVVTPHDAEFAALGGGTDAGDDRVATTRTLARRLGVVVLRKGPTTIVTDGQGPTFVVASGDERLATAGSGDVLAGVIAAFLARGVEPVVASIAAAVVHGLAGSRSSPGAIARDIVAHLGAVLEDLAASADTGSGT